MLVVMAHKESKPIKVYCMSCALCRRTAWCTPSSATSAKTSTTCTRALHWGWLRTGGARSIADASWLLLLVVYTTMHTAMSACCFALCSIQSSAQGAKVRCRADSTMMHTEQCRPRAVCIVV
jgi:hypothetical protein